MFHSFVACVQFLQVFLWDFNLRSVSMSPVYRSLNFLHDCGSKRWCCFHVLKNGDGFSFWGEWFKRCCWCFRNPAANQLIYGWNLPSTKFGLLATRHHDAISWEVHLKVSHPEGILGIWYVYVRWFFPKIGLWWLFPDYQRINPPSFRQQLDQLD